MKTVYHGGHGEHGERSTVGPWFFDVPENQAALIIELNSWRGTPFVPSSGGRADKGAGADCVSFVAGVLANVGAIPLVRLWPRYVCRSGGAEMLGLLVRSMDAVPELEAMAGLSASQIRMGDVLVFSSGKAVHHLCIYAGDNTIWHCIQGCGVTTGNLCDFKFRLIAVYRTKGKIQG